MSKNENSALHFQRFCCIPWDDEPAYLRPRLRHAPGFSLLGTNQAREQHTPFRFKWSPGGLHILNHGHGNTAGAGDLKLLHVDERGVWQGNTPLPDHSPHAQQQELVDFSVDEDHNCYLLEKVLVPESADGDGATHYNRLTATDRDGRIQWCHQGPHTTEEAEFTSLTGDFRKLCFQPSFGLFLLAASSNDVLGLADPTTGVFKQTFTFDKGMEEKVFFNEAGTLLRTLFFEDLNRYGMAAFHPSWPKGKETIGDESLYGPLQFPFGVDEAMSFYVYQLPGMYPVPGITQVAFNGRATSLVSLKDMVTRDADVFIHYAEKKNLMVCAFHPDGRRRQWSIRVRSGEARDYVLVKVDDRDQCYFLVGEGPGSAGTLQVFSRDGKRQDVIAPPFDWLSTVTSLQGFTDWQVDSQGRIYFPIIGPYGFEIVRSYQPT